MYGEKPIKEKAFIMAQTMYVWIIIKVMRYGLFD